jgi:hypothetical protein
MSFYHLTDGHHEDLDSIRRRFLWQGGSKTHKYHMAKWEMVTILKEFGDLGIINTRIMNDCLLNKWIWKIVNRNQSLWCRLLYAKYMKSKDFSLLGVGVVHNTGGVCIESNICSKRGEGQCTRWVMVIRLGFGLMSVLIECLWVLAAGSSLKFVVIQRPWWGSW